MFITTRRHRAIVNQLQEELSALTARNEILTMENRQLHLGIQGLHEFIESEYNHQKHCDSFNNKPCDCRLARAGRTNAN